jgi:hypothetical protein
MSNERLALSEVERGETSLIPDPSGASKVRGSSTSLGMTKMNCCENFLHSLPLGETDPATAGPVRAKERAWERTEVRAILLTL